MAHASAWFEGCPKFVGIWRRLAINLRSSSGCEIRFRLISGSDSNSCGRETFHVVSDSKHLGTVDVIRLLATKWGFTRCDDNTSASCIQLKFRPLLDSSPHILFLLDNIHFSCHANGFSRGRNIERTVCAVRTENTSCAKSPVRAIVANWVRGMQRNIDYRRPRKQCSDGGCSTRCGKRSTVFLTRPCTNCQRSARKDTESLADLASNCLEQFLGPRVLSLPPCTEKH